MGFWRSEGGILLPHPTALVVTCCAPLTAISFGYDFSHAPPFLLSAKGHTWLRCSCASALTTLRLRYQPFAGMIGAPNYLSLRLGQPAMTKHHILSYTKSPIRYGAFWSAFLSILFNNSIFSFAFLSLFDNQRMLEPGDGSNDLPAGRPLFPSEKKEKKKSDPSIPQTASWHSPPLSVPSRRGRRPLFRRAFRR